MSISSSAIQSVRMARFRTDVWATSNSYFSAAIRRPASAASSRPLSLRSTSFHPVKRFSLFQVLSPWRSRTSRYMKTFRKETGLILRNAKNQTRFHLTDGIAPGVACRGAEFLLDAQQLVVLGDAVAAACRSGLDLAGGRADGEVGDGGVLGFTRSVRDDRAVARLAGYRDRVERLGHGSNLVQLHQHRVGDAFLN